MTIILELTPEEEARLRQRSSRIGVTPEEYLRRSLAPKQRKVEPKRSLADRMAEVLGQPELGRGGTSHWSEVEAPCDAA